MTTLYKPVLIESAEQAEALPIGTVARHDDHMPVEKWRDEYGGTHWGYIEESVEVDLLRGWTALVPIEAEEVQSEDCGGYHLLEAWTSTRPFTAYFPKENQ